jgi:hypothetical protein
LLEDTLEDLGHVLDQVEDLAGDENWSLLLEGEDDGVAGAGVELEKLAAELVLHVQDDAGEIGAVVDVVDDDALEADFETHQEVADEVVGKGALLLDSVDRHRNGAADAGVHIDDEALVIVAQEHGTTVGRGHEAFDGDFD